MLTNAAWKYIQPIHSSIWQNHLSFKSVVVHTYFDLFFFFFKPLLHCLSLGYRTTILLKSDISPKFQVFLLADWSGFSCNIPLYIATSILPSILTRSTGSKHDVATNVFHCRDGISWGMACIRFAPHTALWYWLRNDIWTWPLNKQKKIMQSSWANCLVPLHFTLSHFTLQLWKSDCWHGVMQLPHPHYWSNSFLGWSTTKNFTPHSKVMKWYYLDLNFLRMLLSVHSFPSQWQSHQWQFNWGSFCLENLVCFKISQFKANS